MLCSPSTSGALRLTPFGFAQDRLRPTGLPFVLSVYVVEEDWGYTEEKAQVRQFRPDLGHLAHFRTYPGPSGPVTDCAERV